MQNHGPSGWVRHAITMCQLFLAATTIALASGLLCTAHAQTERSPSWQTAAGGHLSFEVASVRQNKTSADGSANVDLLAGDTFSPTNGIYRAKNIGLPELISFAYKLPMDQFKTVVEQVPRLAEPLYDIEARAEGNPTKDQYRLMMQSLLADRFQLKVHFETRQVPIFEVHLAKTGKLGPKLRIHAGNDAICRNPPELPSGSPDVDEDGYPLFCGRPSRVKPGQPGALRFAGRNVTMAQFAASPMRVMADVSRPLIDRTGISEHVDFTIQWVLAARNVTQQDFHPDESMPEFSEALAKQLGLKLLSGKGPVELFIIDHVERPTDN